MSFFLNSMGAAICKWAGWMKPLAKFLSIYHCNSSISLGIIAYILGFGNFATGTILMVQLVGQLGGCNISYSFSLKTSTKFM